jgi:hypothetical protein
MQRTVVMRVIVKKWRNSAAIRIPSGIMEAAQIALDDALDMREQDGEIVMTPKAKTSLIICCPITTQVKGYPLQDPMAGSRPSVALADQVKSLDWVVQSEI